MRRDKEEATIVIEIDWHKEGTNYAVSKSADLCEILDGDTEKPRIYIKKTENPGLEILLKFRANRCIKDLCFREGDSAVEPTRHHEKGECGPGFELMEAIDPLPKDEWWHAIVKNNANDPKEGFELTFWLDTEAGELRIDPRVYNHGHVGDGGLLKLLRAWLRRLFRILFPRHRPQ